MAAILGAALSPVPWRRRLGLSHPNGSVIAVIPAAVGMLALSQSLVCIIHFMGIAEGGALGMLQQVLESLAGGRLVLAVAIIGLLAGTAEELFFRGYMQTRLQQRLGAWAAVAIASALFGVLHLDPVHSPVALLMGFYLGYLAVSSGTIWLSIAAHVANNVVAVIGSAMGVDAPMTGPSLAGYIGILMVCIGCVRILTRASPQNSSPPRGLS
jgi:membrane protease YdiL (CAAX protease family)